jgi:hypothetical protein
MTETKEETGRASATETSPSQVSVSEALKKKSISMGVAGIMNKINKMDTDIEYKKKPSFNKMVRILIFLFFFIFIFKIIDKIFIFYNINRDTAYVYFIWFILIFFLFVLLPLRKSYLKNK